MARLKFDLQPQPPWWDRSEETRLDHEQGIREYWARHYPDHEPEPCDCGYYTPGCLVHCGPGKHRAHCHKDVRSRLESRARHEHKQGLALKRKFPGLGPTPARCCAWCKGPLVHGRVGQRSMHDGRLDEPECRWQYELRTRLEVQRSFLLERDGMGCRGCGAVVGRWSQHREADPERWRAWGPSWAQRYPAEVWVGMVSPTSWEIGLEVDHFIALAFAWEGFGTDPRWAWFFAPPNLRLLCGACHKAKTREDITAVRMAQGRGPEWARADILRRLNDAGLLRIARPEGPPWNANAATAEKTLRTP